MSRLKNKSLQLTKEELFLRQQAREKAFIEEQKRRTKNVDDKDADKIIEIIRREENENVRLEMIIDKKSIIDEIARKAHELEAMEKQLEERRQMEADRKANALGDFAIESVPEQNNNHRIILLTDRKIRKQEGKELEKHFKVVKFDHKKKHHIPSLDYELLILSMKNKLHRDAWARSVQFVEGDENISVVYLSRRGKKLQDIDLIKKQFHANFFRKNLPKNQKNKYLFMLELFTDHLSKLSNSCLPIIRILLKN